MQHKKEEIFRRIEDYIDGYMSTRGRSPNNREIAAGLSLSAATVSRYLTAMKENGQIEFDGQRTFTTKRHRALLESSADVPVLGVVPCGIPAYEEENITGYIRLPLAFFGDTGGSYYILYADGESMADAGIDDGDPVLVRVASEAQAGQIVVAKTENGMTMKRLLYHRGTGRPVLHPENPMFADILPSALEIQGVAVKVLKDVR